MCYVNVITCESNYRDVQYKPLSYDMVNMGNGNYILYSLAFGKMVINFCFENTVKFLLCSLEHVGTGCSDQGDGGWKAS